MRKFLLSLFVFGLSLTAAVASRNVNQKHFVSVMAEEDPCKMESVKYWKITDFPFLNLIKETNLFLTPDEVRWPTGAMQTPPSTFDCNGGGDLTVNVEVRKIAVTDGAGQGANIHCVLHIGRVGPTFGTGCAAPPLQCVQNIEMAYTGDNVDHDIYSVTINSDDLGPGNYEYTCACRDVGPIVDPTTDSDILWIGDNCPAINSFTNGHLIVTGAAPNDDCNGTLVDLNVNTNTVDNFCTSDGTAGFRYVVTNGEFVNVTIATGAGTLLNPELFTVRLDACGNADETLPLTCLPIGTVLLIQAGQDGMIPTLCPDYGTFEITITDIDNGVGNDVCIDADAVNNFGGNNILNCGENGGFTGDIDACPDPEETCFGATTEGVWYSFTTANSLTTFSITTTGGGQYELFLGANCGALTSLGCAVTNLPSDPLTTYFLLVGPTGTVTVTAAPLPTNDLCAGAIAVTAINNIGLTNECATTDLVTCGAESEATVWYSYVLGANDDEVIITSDLPNSVVRVYNACGGALVTDADGVDCDETATLQCRTPGTYFIQVGSSFVNAGPFALNITATPNGVVNDACSEAINIAVVNDCTYQPFNTNTTNACPETFSLACNGGNYNTDPTVWLQFTPPVGVTSINIQNISPAGAYLSILTPCGAGATIPGGGCLFGAGPTPNINVTGGTTYFIAAAIAGNEGQIDFEIRYNDPPVNDICSAALPVVVGANANLTNACAQQELTPCGGSNDQASVWYSYDIPAGVESLEITSTLANGVVQVYEDDCNTILPGTTGACSNTVTIDCPEMQSIRIYVSSPSANTGIFTLTLTQTLQSGIDVCPTGQPLALTEPLCKDPNEFMSDNTGFCPEPAAINFGGCDFSDGPATWYRFTTSATTTLLDIDVLGLGVDFALFTNCVSGPVASSCTTDGSLANLPVTGSTTYNLVISGQGGAEGPFTIEITEKSNAPLNDICTGAFPVNLGSNANLTNLCANEEQLECNGSENEASVWYSYSIPAGVESLTITTNLTGGVLQVLEDDCNTLLNGVTGACTATLTIDCPVAQDIRIFMSSSVANSGTFTLTLTQVNTTAPNDLCANATDIADNPICEFFTVPGSTTVGACPEQFTVAGCAFDYSTESVVWYEFTPPVGTTSIEIENISANTTLTVFNSCPNPNAGTIPAGGGCLSGNGTNGTPILVTAGVTYYIAIGVDGTEGPVDFDIRYNQTLANDNPCVGGFIPTPLTTGVQLTNQNNVCATDDNDCGGAPVENSLWYTFTLGAGFDRITINVTGLTSPSIAVYDVANPCNQTAVNEECNGDGMADFNCLPAGTYTIMIGTSAANAGVFSITATQGTNAGPANDFCTNATNLPGQPYDLCVELGPFQASTINACPETLPAGEIFGACNFNVEETSWYTFTAPGMAGDMPTMDFTYTGYTGTGTPFMNVFEFGPDCSALNAVETTCFQGLNTAFGNIGPLTPGQQYLIAISSIGDTGGDFEFTVKFNLGPANDDKCADLTNFDLGSGGTLLGQTNLCSGADYIIPDCPAADAQNSVWYTFTVDPGSYGVTLLIDQILNNGTPLTGPLAGAVFQDGCNSNAVETTLCFPAKVEQNLDCLEPGTYDLQISTSSANAGDFTITIAQLVDDRMCGASDLSDDCDEAIVINMAGIVCEDILVNGCNDNACPESFNSGACNFGTDPTVWFEFTVDANAAAIDITALTGGYYFAILTNSPCTDNPPTALGAAACISAANTNNIPVTGGATYYMVIANPTGGPFSFRIRQNAYPVNDDPIPSSPRPPFDIPIGGGHSSTTCCAIGVNDDPALDFPNVACATTTHDGAVWYTYTTGGEIGIEIQISSSGANPISGGTTVEVLQGSAAGPSATLFDPNSFDCGALPTSIKVGCYEPGEVIWIKVASSNNDCGEFSININPINRCPMADLCEEAVDVIMPNPTDPNCGDVQPVNIPGCIENACSETVVGDCMFPDLPTVWFQVMVDMEAVQLQTTVITSGTWDPIWAIYYGDCAAPTLLPGGTLMAPVACSNGDSNANIHTVGIVEGVDTYWIAIAGDGVIDDPNFTLGVTTLAGCVACIGEPGCEPQAEWEITARSSDRPLDDPKFCQGEEVTVCINFDYDASETGVDWFHGLIPDFGPGWDLDAFDPEAIVVAPGGAEWADVDGGNCAPLITEQMPFLCTYTDPLTGRLVLCNTGCQACPCSGPLLPNSPLPSGWFWSQNGGAGCENNDCEPYTQYGIGSVVVSINFCVDLTVREFDDPAECVANRSLRFNFQTTSDGVSGCWNDPIAECKLDFAQIGPNWEIDCARPPKILGNDFEICHQGTVDIDLVTEDGSNLTIIVTQIPNPDVTGANDHTFPGGFGNIDDYLTNTSSSTTIQYYEAYADDPNIDCPAPRDTFQVIIYPELIVDLPVLDICFEDMVGKVLIPTITGGTGNYVGYQWSTTETTPSILVTHSGPDMISVTVTDDKGCTGTQVVDVNKLEPLSFTLTPELLTSCANEEIFEVTDIVGNGSPLTITWTYPFGQIFGVDGGTILSINNPFSQPGTYDICATLTDQFGCMLTKCAEYTISLPPAVELGFVTPACGSFTTDLLIQNYVTQLGSTPTFTLLDCGGSIVYSMNGGGPAYQTSDPNGIFEDVDLTLNNCFQLLVEEEGGCSFISEQIVIPLTQGTPAMLSAPASICLGQSTTISVTNAASFPSGTYTWSPSGSGSSFVATPTQTTQYSVTVTNNGCVSLANVLITVNPLPIPGISGATAYCAGESTELTASGGTIYAWSGPGPFAGSMASTGPISTAGTYTVTVTNANGCTATSSATISEEAFITVQISPVTICDGSLDSLNAGFGFDSYQWFFEGNPIGDQQFQQVTQAGNYTVSVTDGNCLGGGTGVVVNNVTPTIDLPTSVEVCRLNTGVGPTTLDFVAIADTMLGQWFNIDNASVNTSNWGNVDFTTIASADTFRFVFITNTAVAPCVNATDTMNVIVRNCACPNPAIRPIGPLCNSSTAPYNLNNTFINQMPPLPGDWTVVAPSPTPFPTITGNTIVVTGATPGTYTVRFTYNPPSPGNCPKFIENTLVVSPAPAISSRNTTLCNADIGAGPVTANLDTLLVGLIEPSPGSWTQIDGATPMGTLPNIDVTGMSRDTLRFQYTTTAVAPCVPRTAIVEVIIRNCECPVVTLVNDELCNGSMTLLDLESAANFTIDPTTITGTWTAQTPLTITNGNFINPFGVTASATPYTVTFTLNGTFPADCQTVFTKTVRIRNQPVAEKLNDGEACSASTGNGATDLRLTSLLRPGYTTGGTWTQISPATPQLTIPPTSIVEFNGQVPGTMFVFRYTPPITLPSPCMPVTVDVTVTIKDCNCPDGNIACPGDCDLCNNGGILDLATTIVSPTTFAPGNWSVVTGPNDDEQSLNGTIFDANGLPSGTYTVIYTLVPTPTGGCPRTDEFDIFIANDQTAVIIPDTLVCNGQNGVTTFDVGSLKVSGNGSWFDEAGNNITVNTNIDLTGLAPGTVLNFTFESVFTDPCPQNTYPVTIRITDNCNCPEFILGDIPELCTNANIFDLNPYSAALLGTWSALDPSLVITNGILTLTGVAAGPYDLVYTVTNPEPGCDVSMTTRITIYNPKSAGTARGAEFCLGATDIVTLRDRLDNEDGMGTWTVVSGGSTGFNATAGTFNLTGRPAGTYVFKYAFTNQSPCPNDEEEITIRINPLPVADAGTDKNIDCTVQSAVLGTDLTSSGTNIVYEWKLLNAIVGTSKNYTALAGGTYVLTVRDTVTNCSSTDNVVVIQADDLPIFDIAVDTIACFGDVAQITLSNIRGGQSPYEISFNGGQTYGSALVASNLGAGTYKVQVRDANGCVNDQLPAIVITSPPLFAVNLGQDFFLNITEDSLLSIIGQYDPNAFQSITWYANDVEIVSARDQGSYNAKPELDTRYRVTVINESGCIATDEVRISIRRVKPECVPNIFSPNESEVNEYFSINCAEVALVTKYSIYDRWGNLLFVGENLSPDNPSSFWDGKFKGQDVVPGVYAYYLEMLFKDGSTEKRGGDVTVIR